MTRSARLKLFAAVLGVILVALVAVGAPEVRDAIDRASNDAFLTEPGEYQLPSDSSAIALGTFPNVAIFDVNDVEHSSSSLVGEPLVVNLWFAACPPCQREMPAFAEVAARLDGQVRFVGVDPVDSIDEMLRFAADKGVGYELFRDPYADLTDALGTVGFPYTVFVAPNGQIVGDAGVLDAAELERKISSLFGIETGDQT